jgi:Phosphodiester glycosidase
MTQRLPAILKGKNKIIVGLVCFISLTLIYLLYATSNNQILLLKSQIVGLLTEKDAHVVQLEAVKSELETLQSQDQVQINNELKAEISNIQKTYNQAIETYEHLLILKEKSNKTPTFDELFTDALVLLRDKNYASASAILAKLDTQISEEEKKLASSVVIPANIVQNNTPPGAGYSRQQVSSDAGNFMVSVVAADTASTKIIVDTASESDCGNNCPVLPLATYVSRNNAFAGINGSYFCPASYPSCNGKTNSFDLLVMNKNKYYFNSSNNVYSSNPAVIFGSGYIRFVSSASQWGRDTGVDGVISNYPLLVEGGAIRFGGDDDPKKGSVGNRSFVSNKGTTAYIGIVHNATVAESARVLKAMGMENAMNLDSGGSTALWSGGYKSGPGRDIPNAILFVKR